MNSSLHHANARLCNYSPQATGDRQTNIEMGSSDQLHQRSPPAPVKALLRQMTDHPWGMLVLVAVGGLILLADLLELGLDDLDNLRVI